MPFRNPLRSISADRIINWGLATIIGAFYKTSETGNRWEIGTEVDPPFDPAYIRGYTGETDELTPSEFSVNQFYTTLKAGSHGNAAGVGAQIYLSTSEDGVNGQAEVQGRRILGYAEDYITLNATGAVLDLYRFSGGAKGAVLATNTAGSAGVRSLTMVEGSRIQFTPGVIQTGKNPVAACAASGGQANVTVTFSEPFETIPRVFAMPYPGRLTASIASVSTTGAEFRFYNWTSANSPAGDMNWIAAVDL